MDSGSDSIVRYPFAKRDCHLFINNLLHSVGLRVSQVIEGSERWVAGAESDIMRRIGGKFGSGTRIRE